MADQTNEEQAISHQYEKCVFQLSNHFKRPPQINLIVPPFTASGTELPYPSPKPCTVVPGDGVVPEKEATYLVSNRRESPWLSSEVRRPVYRVVHPQGFRILKDDNVLERNLRGYFRLPPVPSKHLRQERQDLQKALMSIERQERMRQKRSGKNQNGAQRGVVLDGFFLLNAAGTDTPEAVEAVTLQCSYLVSSIPEDLSFFTKLVFLDVSENSLNVEDLLALTSLETLHIACNKISSLAGISQALHQQQQGGEDTSDSIECGPNSSNTLTSTKSLSFHDVLLPNLTALNLSYNRIPASHLPLLVHFPCLEKLDLSGNDIKVMPSDLSFLTGVTHFALENNQFRSAQHGGGEPDVFQSLSTMPSLVEVNLNHNQLSNVPPLSMHNGRGLCFPSIEIIGIADNQFQLADNLAELGYLHRTLRQIVLTNNPICLDLRNIDTLKRTFSSVAEATFHEHEKRNQVREEDLGSPFRNAPNAESTSLNVNETVEGWMDNDWVRLISPLKKDCGHSSLQSAARAAAAAAAEAGSGHSSARSHVRTSSDKIHCTLDSPPCLSVSYHSDDAPPTRQPAMLDHKNSLVSEEPYVESEGVMLSRTSFTNVEAYLRAHQIEIVVHESFMRKQPLKYFYATHTCRAGRNLLVTVPPYKEFMDIYRLTHPKGKVPRRNAFFPPKPSLRATPLPLLPPSPSAAADFAPMQSSGAGNAVVREAQPGLPPGTFAEPHPNAAFFITELENQATQGLPHAHSASTDLPHSDAPLVGAPKRKETKDRLPSVISPSSVNVHRALAELKNLLRKPLPFLPYSCKHHE